MTWDKNSSAALRKRLLKWFDGHQRDLPWRKNKTPYRIWVSEIMLQQTQVATVIDYYLRFMKRFPTVKKLAAADQSEVLKLWEGLGYYRRARQLHAAAMEVVENRGGVFPETFDDVLSLPGIGRYTAGAILSIAKDQRLPILEGNTIRLYARLLGMKSDPRTTANQKVLWEFAETILPRLRCGDFNQSLMEVGNQICKPKQPLCHQCPISCLCPTFVKGWQDVIPAKGKKVVYEDLREAVVLVCKTVGGQQKWLVRVCGADERWTGLWDFPRYQFAGTSQTKSESETLADQLKLNTGLSATLSPLGRPMKHAVTKYRIELHCFEAVDVKGRLKKQSTETKWATLKQLKALPMSTTGRKIVDSRLSGDPKRL
jgi:A/G-specific adenine glycosylase